MLPAKGVVMVQVPIARMLTELVTVPVPRILPFSIQKPLTV